MMGSSKKRDCGFCSKLKVNSLLYIRNHFAVHSIPISLFKKEMRINSWQNKWWSISVINILQLLQKKKQNSKINADSKKSINWGIWNAKLRRNFKPKAWKPILRKSFYLTSGEWRVTLNWWESTATIKRPLASVINLRNRSAVWGLSSVWHLHGWAPRWRPFHFTEHLSFRGDSGAVTHDVGLKMMESLNFWFRGAIFTNKVVSWILPSSLTLKYSTLPFWFLSFSRD